MQFFETFADAFTTLTLLNYLIIFTTIFLAVIVILYASYNTWFEHSKLLERMFICGEFVLLFLLVVPLSF